MNIKKSIATALLGCALLTPAKSKAFEELELPPDSQLKSEKAIAITSGNSGIVIVDPNGDSDYPKNAHIMVVIDGTVYNLGEILKQLIDKGIVY